MKAFKYVSLISASLLLLGGLAAGQANAQSRSLSTRSSNNSVNGQENGQTNNQAAPAANAEAGATSGRSLSTQGENTNFSTLGITPEAYIQRIMSIQNGQPGVPQAGQAQGAATVPAPAAALPGESEYDRLMRLGYAESRVGNYTLAQQYFEQALVVNPGDRMATIAYWNMENAIQKTAQAAQTGQSTQTIARVSNGGAASTANAASDFDGYMNAGYSATEARDYQTALQYFNAALQLRPNNPYALQAIRNVNTYIQAGQ
ncbi:MAG: tetratricopeptide repeat protein [Cyanobacteria bacterium Co-bin13]|nr:tetratricopeptide repeat protein [Cyanobacteria bacterium Co-bin13]